MSPTLSDDALLSPSSAWRVVGDQAVLLSVTERKLHLLNEVGSRIWALIQERRKVGEIVRKVAEEYDVSRERAETDVHAFIRKLVRQRVCSLSEPKSEARVRLRHHKP